MATLVEMLESSFFLILNSVILILITVAAGPIMDWLAIWISNQPAGPISASPLQFTFGLFYGLICLLELGLFIQLYLTVIKRTNYATGETEI